MHIAFFTNFYLPIVNGVVRSVESFRSELTNQGHNVFVFAQTDQDYVDQAPFIFRYPSLRLPTQVKVSAVIPVSPFVDQLLPALKLDVIHTHHPFLLGQTAAGKAEDLGLPLVFTFHTQYQEYTHYVPLPQEAIQEFLKDAIQNWLMDFIGKCHHIVVPSESMKETLVRDYGLRDRYTVIPTGIDLELYRRAGGRSLRSKLGWQKDKVLVSSGRLGQEKNWDTLFKAVKKAHQKHPELRFVLIGDGLERESLQNLAAELGIAERIIFTGEVPFSEVVRYLKAADVFGFASVTETQGLVMEETLRFQEFAVRALLNDLAITNDDDPVRIADGGQAVGDDKTGASLHQAQQRLLDPGFGARVHAGGGFIEDEDAWVSKHGAGDREQLALSLAEVAGAFGEPGLISLRHLLDEMIRIGQLGGFDTFLVGGVEPPVANVFHDGVGEQEGILQYNAEFLTQIIPGDVTDVTPVDGDAAGVDFIEAGQQLMMVVLPAPVGPTSAIVCPALASRVMFLMIS
jgi:1,2-diacylglycerol 3-alpha-glucosyltransferase